MPPFVPTYIFENELTKYGLPTPTEVPEIMSLVSFASTLIDEECGRYDGDGSGSLVYSTYTQRLLLQTRNRNLVPLAMKPIVSIDSDTVASLSGLVATGQVNPYYSGIQANTLTQPNKLLSGIISASGRYTYTRQDNSVGYPDLFAMINPLNLVAIMGGPAPWVALDVTNIDYDPKTGEAWIPAGLQLQRYSEVIVTYNSGYDPRNMPYLIKLAAASIVKNAQLRGNATTSMLSMHLGRSGANATFTPSLIDPTIQAMLTPFRTVRAA